MGNDNVINLVSVYFIPDRNGVQQPRRKMKTVFCSVKSVKQSAFYAAQQSGLKPAYVFVVKSFEYDGQQEVEFEGRCYSVLRTYALENDGLELTVQEAAGIGDKN